MIVLAIAIPLNIVILLVINQLTAATREVQQAGMQHSARAVAAAVDAELGKYVALAESLSRSASLLSGDLAAFDVEARRAFAGISDAWILVADLDGQQLLNTAVGFGRPLPMRSPEAIAAQQRAVANRSQLLSNIRIGPVTNAWVASVELPIFKNDAPYRVLAVIMNMKPFLRLLYSQQMPSSWLAGIIDGDGRYVARTPGMESMVGVMASDGWRASRSREGFSEFRSREGDAVINANGVLKLGSWTVGVAIKKAELQAAVWRATRWSLALAGLLSLSSLAFAWGLARRITTSLAKLHNDAAGTGMSVVPADQSDPPEIVALSHALQEASAEREASALRQGILLEITSGLIEAHQRNELAEIVFQALGPPLGADVCLKYRFDGNGEFLDLAYQRGLAGDDLADASRLSIGQSFCRTVAGTLEPLIADAGRIAVAPVAALLRKVGARAYCCHPLRTKDGRVLGTFALGSKTRDHFAAEDVALFATATNVLAQAIDRFEAEKSSHEANAKFRALFEQSTTFAGVMSLDGTLLEANDLSVTGCGFRRDDVIGRKFWDCGWWSRSPQLREMIESGTRQAAAGRTFHTETSYFVADGSERRIELAIVPVTDDDGRVLFLAPSGVDITQREQLQASLRQSHDTFRHLVDHSPFGIYAVDADFRLSQVSTGAQKVFENVHPLLGRDFAEILHILWNEPFANEVIAHFRHTLETGQTYRASRTIERRNDIDAVEAYDWKIERVILPDGRPGVVCHFYDLSDRQRHETELRVAHERQKVLMRELAHRGKNLIAVIQAIANRSFSADRPLAEARGVFAGRLMALADTFGRLTEDAAETSSLNAIVTAGLNAFSDRVDITGPHVMLPAKVAQTFALVVHELATNAAKYGALSVPGGRVAVAWRTVGTNGGARFRFEWRESNGPPCSRPARVGFGTVLVTTIAGAEFGSTPVIDYGEGGLEYSIDAPLTSIGNVEADGPAEDAPHPQPAVIDLDAASAPSRLS